MSTLAEVNAIMGWVVAALLAMYISRTTLERRLRP